ncbi:MAG: hypothetical protein RLZ50_186 [Bacteroidota bacterium]|jgi:hypothetical protein
MKLFLFFLITTLIISGCYPEYRYPRKSVVVYNRYNNYRNNYNRPLFYSSKPNLRLGKNLNTYRYKPRVK